MPSGNAAEVTGKDGKLTHPSMRKVSLVLILHWEQKQKWGNLCVEHLLMNTMHYSQFTEHLCCAYKIRRIDSVN